MIDFDLYLVMTLAKVELIFFNFAWMTSWQPFFVFVLLSWLSHGHNFSQTFFKIIDNFPKRRPCFVKIATQFPSWGKSFWVQNPAGVWRKFYNLNDSFCDYDCSWFGYKKQVQTGDMAVKIMRNMNDIYMNAIYIVQALLYLYVL